MEVIILAISVGVALLWGGVFAMIKMVDLFERKHILGLGAYTTLVAGMVMGLVLFTVYDRQKEHRRELQKQMETVTKRLSELSDRLVGQLVEKADLTASEFEIRARLQTEQEQHRRTQKELADETRELDKERRARAQYQQDQNRKLDQRFEKEEERYKEMLELIQTSRSTLVNTQKQLASMRDDGSRLRSQVTDMQSTQNSLLAKVNTSLEVEDLNSQKVDALAR